MEKHGRRFKSILIHRYLLNPVKFVELGELTRIATIQGTGVFLILRACRLHLHSELLALSRDRGSLVVLILGGPTSRKLHKRKLVLTKLLRRLITIDCILHHTSTAPVS
jgi:hypothetical protein